MLSRIPDDLYNDVVVSGLLLKNISYTRIQCMLNTQFSHLCCFNAQHAHRSTPNSDFSRYITTD